MMMIKGVNKKVLEINNPQSLYFEKAVLYLKPNLDSISHKMLSAEAQKMLRSLSPKQPVYASILKIAIIMSVFLIGFLGALTAFMIVNYL